MSANQSTSLAFWLVAMVVVGFALDATMGLAGAQDQAPPPVAEADAAPSTPQSPLEAKPEAPSYPSEPTAQKQPRVPLNVSHAGSADDPYTWAGQDAIRSKLVGRQHTPSPLLLPDQQLPIRFSHRAHLAEDMSCTDCHSMVLDSVRASDVNLPPEATCFDCHYPSDAIPDPAEADPPAACETCHPGYTADFPPDVDDFEETHLARVAPPDVIIPAPNIKFNHKIHLDEGVDCKTCHGTMEDVDLATRENSLPTMGTCLTCHDNKQASFRCETCHLTDPSGRMKTDFEGEKLMPAGWYMADAHDEAFLTNHKHAAQLNDGYCENCHKPKFCMDCHNGVQKPLKIHPNNWILTHPVAARKYDPTCSSCHRQQSFCVDCHQQTKVAWEPRGQGQAALRAQGIKFHPEGWSDFTGRGPNHHAFQAQRNINACASCHTEQTCLQCHSTTTANVNPHPPGFGNSAVCRSMYRRNHRACTKCHTATDPKLQLCR